MMRDEINDRLRAAVHHFKTGDGAPTVSGLGGDWATTDISVSYDDGYMVLHLKPLFPVTDLTADKPAGGAPLEVDGLKFTAHDYGVSFTHKGSVYGLTWKSAAKLTEWLCVEVDKHRAPVVPTESLALQHQWVGRIRRPLCEGYLSPEALTATVWSGEGLPPVGCVCEANFTGDWVKFEMLYLGTAHVIFKTGFEMHRTRGDFDTCGVKFRPLRTAEQLAAEARETEVDRLCKVVMAHPAYQDHNRDIHCSAAMRLAVEAIVDNRKFDADA